MTKFPDYLTALTADASPDGAADYVVTYDASASTTKKVLLNNLPGAAGLGTTAARATRTTAQSIPNSTATIVNFATVTYDPATAITTGASWHYTVPATGIYLVTAAILFDASSATPNSNIQLFKNGSLVSYLDSHDNTASAQDFLTGTDMISLSAGDTLDIRAQQTSGGALSLTAAGSTNYVAIVRVG